MFQAAVYNASELVVGVRRAVCSGAAAVLMMLPAVSAHARDSRLCNGNSPENPSAILFLAGSGVVLYRIARAK